MLKSNFPDKKRRLVHVPLSILSGEQTAERFTNCDRYLRDQGAHLFYRAGRLSPDGGMQVGVFKRALQQVRITEQEKALYEPWQAMSRAEILQRAANNTFVVKQQIEVLRENGDIAVHIMDTLQNLQADMFPDVPQDVNTYAISKKAFAAVLSSIHGQPLNNTVA